MIAKCSSNHRWLGRASLADHSENMKRYERDHGNEYLQKLWICLFAVYCMRAVVRRTPSLAGFHVNCMLQGSVSNRDSAQRARKNHHKYDHNCTLYIRCIKSSGLFVKVSAADVHIKCTCRRGPNKSRGHGLGRHKSTGARCTPSCARQQPMDTCDPDGSKAEALLMMKSAVCRVCIGACVAVAASRAVHSLRMHRRSNLLSWARSIACCRTSNHMYPNAAASNHGTEF